MINSNQQTFSVPDNNVNLRVYGVIVDNKSRVLVSDEYHLDMYMTKFPGGAMEFGEGTVDCLKREIIEEVGEEIEVLDHLYTTDFFQTVLFNDKMQLVNIYYLARFVNEENVVVSDKKYDFDPVNGSQSFRWIHVNDLTSDIFTLPIDKRVADIIKQRQDIINNL
jgi:ADP-ribose pyrophosphatase YjhB (NUDIX family)